MNGRLMIAGVVIAATAAGGGLALYQARQLKEHTENSSPAALASVPDFSFPDLQGHPRRANEWMGKVLVLNFWATWCPPCQQEIPTFVKYQDTYGNRGLQFVGIAVDDPDAVREFADANGVHYPLLIGQNDAVALSLRLGNRFSGLPFTVVFDREGRVRLRRLGEVSAETLDKQVIPLLGPSPTSGS